MKKVVGFYEADKGTFVLNGVGFTNGVGDGRFDIIIDTDEASNEEKKRQKAWFDIRDFAASRNFTYKDYDCDGGKDCELILDMNAEAVLLFFDADGNAIFKKYF